MGVRDPLMRKPLNNSVKGGFYFADTLTSFILVILQLLLLQLRVGILKPYKLVESRVHILFSSNNN